MPSLVRRLAVALATLAAVAACHGGAAGDAPPDTVGARDAHWGTTLPLRVANSAELDTAVLFPEPERVVGAVPVTLHELVAEGADSSKARAVRFQVQRIDVGADTTDAEGYCPAVLRDRRTGVQFVRTRWFVEGHTTRKQSTLGPNTTQVTLSRTRIGRADYEPTAPAPVRVPAGAWVRVECGATSFTVLGLAPSPNLGA